MSEYQCKACGSIVYTLEAAVKHRLAMHTDLIYEGDILAYFNELEWGIKK